MEIALQIAAGVVVLAAVGVLIEYRLRRPDQLVLFDSKGVIGFRRARWYPRHLSLPLPGTTHQMELKVEAVGRGGLPVTARLVLTVAPSRTAIPELIRVGGWRVDAVARAAEQMVSVYHALVREYTEQRILEEHSCEGLRQHLAERAEPDSHRFGLEIVSLTVQAIDPVDETMAEALRRREAARILEQTEVADQQGRVAAAQARVEADEQIAALEHGAELARIERLKEAQEHEAKLDQLRLDLELERGRMKLELDREELALLNENPQLLLLTPQAARLAEASQTLRNARTVVSLSPNEAEQGARLFDLFQRFLAGLTGKPGETNAHPADGR